VLQTIRVTNCFAIANARQIGYGFLSMLTCDRKIAISIQQTPMSWFYDFFIRKELFSEILIHGTSCHSTWLSFLSMLSPNPFETDYLYYYVEQFYSCLAVHVHSKYCCRVSHSVLSWDRMCVANVIALRFVPPDIRRNRQGRSTPNLHTPAILQHLFRS